jgi:hypothetical protein
MLFYALLFLCCLAVSSLLIWLSRFVPDLAKAIYRAILPVLKKYLYPEKRQVTLGQIVADKGAGPWGWSGSLGNVDIRDYRFGGRSAVQALQNVAGKILNRRETRNREGRPLADWPYKCEKMGYTDRDYELPRQLRIRNPKFGGAPKPWGW